MQTLQRELKQVFFEILQKYNMEDREAASEELANAAKEFHYQQPKKGDLVDGMLYYAEQAKARGEDKVEEVLNALERLLRRNIQRSGQWQDLARWMLKRKESEPYQRWADWYMADAFQAKTSWRLTPDQVRACWPQAFAEPEPAADDARYKPYTAENSMTFITPEEAREWERKWHLKKRQAEQLDKLPTAP